MKSSATFSKQQLVAFAQQFFDGKPNPEAPSHTPSHWDSLTRRAVRNSILLAAESPPGLWDLWGTPVSLVALNPQPLPPGFELPLSLAREVIDRAQLMQDLADAMHPDYQQPGVARNYIKWFLEDLCPIPTKIKIPKKKWPFPWPPESQDWSAMELAVMGTAFQEAAMAASNESLQQIFNDAGENIFNAAFSRL